MKDSDCAGGPQWSAGSKRRYYEELGLLPADRAAARGYRLFGGRHLPAREFSSAVSRPGGAQPSEEIQGSLALDRPDRVCPAADIAIQWGARSADRWPRSRELRQLARNCRGCLRGWQSHPARERS